MHEFTNNYYLLILLLLVDLFAIHEIDGSGQSKAKTVNGIKGEGTIDPAIANTVVFVESQ